MRASYVQTGELDRYAEDRMIAGVRQRRARRASRRRVQRAAASGAAVLAVAVAVFFLVGRLTQPPTWVGQSLETGAQATEVRLRDGSTVTLAPASRIELESETDGEVRLALERGGATFDVVVEPERRFVVRAPGLRVSVLGTRFSVVSEPSAGGTQTRVDVERGRVEVRVPGRAEPVATLAAGETWTEVVETAAGESDAPSAEPEREPEAAPETAPGDASAQLEPVPAPSPRDQAKRLLKQGNAARAQGDYETAIAKYEALVARYPDDPAASLAALELGRLRMYRGDDPEGAARAIERSLDADPQSPLREDSMAKLVEAREREGDRERCIQARGAYLREYPNGAHAAEVRRRCRGLK